MAEQKHRGAVAYIKRGRMVRFRRQDLDAFMVSRKSKSAA
jgi:hypothetical protein